MFIDDTNIGFEVMKGWCVDGSNCTGLYYIYDDILKDLNTIDYLQCTSESKIQNYTADNHRSMLYLKGKISA